MTNANVDCVFAENCASQINHTAYIEAATTITCDRPEPANNHSKISVVLCKETDDFDCESASKMNKNGRRFVPLTEEKYFKVTITDVISEDHGVYWCATFETDYKESYRKVYVTVRSGK